MTNKYRSLEHIILNLMVREAVGTTDGGQFVGNQPIALKSQKVTVPQKELSTGPQAISKAQTLSGQPPPKTAIVPNQGDQQDTPTGMEVSRESGGKKKIKEDTDSTNVKLIKQGSGPATTTTSMLNKGPLTQYTNPQNPSQPSNSAEPKSSLSFQTPDLSGKEDDSDVETPPKKKLGAGAQKPTSDNVTKKINPEQAEKTVNKILGTPGVKMSTPGTKMSTPSTGSGAGKAPQMLSKASNDNLQPAKIADAGGDGRSTKAINTNAGNDVDPGKFNNQQQATPPVSPGSGAAGNSPKAAAPAMQNPTSPSVKKADVIGKEIGVDGQSKAQQVSAPPPFDPKNLPLSRAAAIVPGMREPHKQASVKSAGLMNVSNDVSNLPPIKVTPDGATGEFSDKEKKGKLDDKSPGMPSTPSPDSLAPDWMRKSPKNGGVGSNVDDKSPGVPDTPSPDSLAPDSMRKGTPKADPGTAGEKPGSKEGWEHAWESLKGKLSPEERKEYEAQREKMQPKEREEFDRKSLAIWLLGGAAAGGVVGGFLGRRAATGAAAGAGAGLGEKALEGAGLLSIIKHFVNKGASGQYGNRGGGGGGGFVTAPQGQISGTPTRRKGGMSEEVQNLDKVRRALSLVGRRDGDNKKKPTLGRQAAIKTNIIDEARYVAMMREAIKEKQKKDKEEELEPGEHKTKIDVHPQIKKEPQDNIRQ